MSVHLAWKLIAPLDDAADGLYVDALSVVNEDDVREAIRRAVKERTKR